MEPDGTSRIVTRPDHPHGKVTLFRLTSPATVLPSQSCRAVPIVAEFEGPGVGSHEDIRSDLRGF